MKKLILGLITLGVLTSCEKEDVEQIPSLGSRDVEDRPVREETGYWADAAQQTTTPASKKAASKKKASKKTASKKTTKKTLLK